jgi:post-segregation antitoxin (ccd killing protein)
VTIATSTLSEYWLAGHAGERVSYPSRIASKAKLSVSLPDDLVQDLRDAAHDNVSAFVTAAVRHELDRRRLFAFVDELADELGPVDEAEVAKYSDLFAGTAAVTAERKTASR